MKAQLGTRIELRGPFQLSGDTKVMERTAETSPRLEARIAGVLYLIVIIGGFFAIGYVPAALVVPGDAAATVSNIQAHEFLYRLGLAAHIFLLPCNLPLVLIFYDLLKVVNKKVALLAAAFTLVGTAVEGANMLNQFGPLILLGGGSYASVLTAGQLQAQVSMALGLQTVGYNIAQVIYAFYCILTGYLIVRSSFLPRIIGVLMATGGLAYLTYSFASFLAPGFAAHLVPYIQLPSGAAELSLCLWLLVMGVNVSRWEKQAGAAREPGRSLPDGAAA